MTTTWSSEELERFGRSEELEIAPRSADGTLRRWTPIWVVGVGEDLYVRTWHRRGDGWFGQVVDSRRARIRVDSLEADVAVEDIGNDEPALRRDIDVAYRCKYARYGDATVDRMATDEAAAATLHLVAERKGD